jgi:hypothetical protein
MGTVTQLDPYPPQKMGLELELVATETGQSLWTSELQLDAATRACASASSCGRPRKRPTAAGRESVQLTLVSPERFARFAAWEVATSTLRPDETTPGPARALHPRNASSAR